MAVGDPAQRAPTTIASYMGIPPNVASAVALWQSIVAHTGAVCKRAERAIRITQTTEGRRGLVLTVSSVYTTSAFHRASVVSATIDCHSAREAMGMGRF